MKEKFLELLENKDYKQIKKLILEMHEQDIAELLEEIDEVSEIIKVFRLIPKDQGAEIFSYASPELQEKIVSGITDKELQFIISDMYLDDAVDFIEEMPANVVERILKNSTPQNRAEINKFLSYKDDTAGSIMTNEFLDVKRGTTIANAIERIRKIGNNLETINTIYITDQKRIIEGCVSIRDLILAEPNKKIEEIMETNVVFAYTNTDQEEVAQLFKKYDIIVLPIVDTEKRLVGIVTVDDAVSVIEEENTEDIQKMAAITPNDKEYLKTSVWSIWLQRAPWLLLLMISSIFTGLIITANEQLLSASEYGIILTASIPMLMNTGGNCGSQSSTTIIRGLALNEIKFKDTFKVLWKEFRVSILLAATLSVISFVKFLFVDGLFWQENGIFIALIIAISLIATVIVAKAIGCLLPMLAKKLKLDPAVMATPLITTLVDIISLMIYCNIAIALLP